jgi:hypothetical protein
MRSSLKAPLPALATAFLVMLPVLFSLLIYLVYTIPFAIAEWLQVPVLTVIVFVPVTLLVVYAVVWIYSNVQLDSHVFMIDSLAKEYLCVIDGPDDVPQGRYIHPKNAAPSQVAPPSKRGGRRVQVSVKLTREVRLKLKVAIEKMTSSLDDLADISTVLVNPGDDKALEVTFDALLTMVAMRVGGEHENTPSHSKPGDLTNSPAIGEKRPLTNAKKLMRGVRLLHTSGYRSSPLAVIGQVSIP